MKYFKNLGTLEELRKQYKELLKQYHPDNGGDVAAMQEINLEYDTLFKQLKNRHESKADNSNKSGHDNMQYDFEEDTKLREALQKVVVLNDVIIEIIGNWLWISGNTYQHKEYLKEIGFKYARKKHAWYFHTEAFRKKGHKTLSMDDIRNYYGSTEVKADGRRLLKQA